MEEIDGTATRSREPAGRERIAGEAVGARRRRWVVGVLAATLLSGCGYGRMQELDDQARSARSDIEVQLQRRAELVPNLIETVRAYGTVSEETVAAVADARAELVGAVRSGDLGAMQESSAELGTAISRLLGAAGAGLETDPGFKRLRAQLDGTEERIRAAGIAYNAAVLRYNAYIREFPQLVTAKVIGAEELESFDYADGVPVLSPAGE